MAATRQDSYTDIEIDKCTVDFEQGEPSNKATVMAATRLDTYTDIVIDTCTADFERGEKNAAASFLTSLLTIDDFGQQFDRENMVLLS